MGKQAALPRVEYVKPGMGLSPAVALVNPKYGHNVAGALRACSAFGAKQLWVSGERALEEWSARGRLPREERMKAYGAVGVCLANHFFDAYEGTDTAIIGVEVMESAQALTYFEHPAKALYVFGPEDGGLGAVEKRHCHDFVIIPSDHCLNLATAVTTVLADRRMKRQRAGLERLYPSAQTLREHRGFADDDNPLRWEQ